MKSQYRNPKEARMFEARRSKTVGAVKLSLARVWTFEHSDFGFPSDFPGLARARPRAGDICASDFPASAEEGRYSLFGFMSIGCFSGLNSLP